jgi:protein SCO1/2
MSEPVVSAVDSEAQFAELVDFLAADPVRCEKLNDLLAENHPCYNERSGAEIVRMRGWVLLALARTGVSERQLPFLLEEFDAGTDAYLVGAAARALVSYPHRDPAFVPFVLHALANARDEPLSFEAYGEYATSSTGPSAVSELLAVLAWLGPHAISALPELASMRAQPGRLSKRLIFQLDRTVASINEDSSKGEGNRKDCCALQGSLGQRWWTSHDRKNTETADSIIFEDQDGSTARFREFFRGTCSIVVFFYTRCDNPWKCSLTITKLARVQHLLAERGLSDQIKTAAITYDPVFDLPKRLRDYGHERDVQFDVNHRMFRAIEGFAALRKHFDLGVNFIESFVNRHRIELFILDSVGCVAASFERVHWNESEVVERASAVLRDNVVPSSPARSSVSGSARAVSAISGTLASLVWAFFPKCPLCWAAYLSVFGITGAQQILYFSKMRPVLLALMLINTASVWFRARATRRMSGLYLVGTGTSAIIFARTVAASGNLAAWGIALTFAGSLMSAVDGGYLQRILNQFRIRLRNGCRCVRLLVRGERIRLSEKES